MQVNEEQNIGDTVGDQKTEQGLRSLDAEVAERVMGEPMPPAPIDCPHFRNILSPQKAWHHVRDFDHGDGDCKWEPEPFSTSIEAAMRVVEHLQPTQEEYNAGRKSCRFIIRQQDNGTWSIEARSPFLTSYNRPAFADSKSLPEAICRAALALVNKPDTNSANSIHPAHGQASKTEVQK